MIVNNIKADFNAVARQAEETQSHVSELIGVLQPSLARTLARNTATEMYVKAIEAMGYDIELTYIKRQ